MAWDAPDCWADQMAEDAARFAKGHSEEIRLTDRGQLHCTLLFLGEVPVEELEGVKNAFNQIAFATFPSKVMRAVLFPATSEPRVLAYELESQPDSCFQDLHRTTETAMTGFQVKRDKRRFRPHITVGRCRDLSSNLASAWLSTSAESYGEVPLERVTLYRSHLTGNGSSYEKLAVRSLD